LQHNTEPLSCLRGDSKERADWIEKLRVTPGADHSQKRYLKTSHIETAKKDERCACVPACVPACVRAAVMLGSARAAGADDTCLCLRPCRRDIYYSFAEVLYSLCERRAGKSMPVGNEELDTLRVRATMSIPCCVWMATTTTATIG
jgi:hypothetical protein